ncbi:MAG: hypothetical protein PGN13_07160 [Patulibacter minatonensis]
MTLPTTSTPAALDPGQTNQQISETIGAMLLLNSSCQALIEVSVAPSTSEWYAEIDAQLGAAENLVVGWRQRGYLYFKTQVLEQIVACGNTFTAAAPAIDAAFAALEQDFVPLQLVELQGRIERLGEPVAGLIAGLDVYDAALAEFQQQLQGPHQQLNTLIAQIQAQEADLQEQITQINDQIAQLQQQVATDRAAIAKADAQRTDGIIETIFGVLLAPFTGGASLILAGIGVATIAEAQGKVDALESEISQSQTQIAGDQTELTDDQRQVATLTGLSLSTGLAMDDIDGIDTALTSLRTTWTVLTGAVTAAAQSLASAESYDQALVAKVWFDAAVNSWTEIISYVGAMNELPEPQPTHVQVGS